MSKKKNKTFTAFFILAALLILTGLASCYHVPNKIEPRLSYECKIQELKSLSNTFAPLTPAEKSSDWGKEYLIGLAFAKKLDLYRAISTLERADILISAEKEERKEEIQYFILLCYYLANRYEALLQYFQQSELYHADKSFPAFEDLLIILHESYLQTGKKQQALKIEKMIAENFPETAQKLKLAAALIDADFKALDKFKKEAKFDYIAAFLNSYEAKKKSVSKAKALNALLPGAGYFYLGQKRTALTAFLLNGLFIFATCEFFHKGYTAAAIITLSFEAGWYFGGINGAGEEAKYYNERLYQRKAQELMRQEQLFPFFSLRYAF